jgi:hypothetical protein
VADLHQTDVVLDGRAVLESEKDSGAFGSMGFLNVGGGTPRRDQIRVPFKAAIPDFNVGYRLAKVFVVTDGGVDRVHATFPHLPENLLRPVSVLQGVDPNRYLIAHLVSPNQ